MNRTRSKAISDTAALAVRILTAYVSANRLPKSKIAPTLRILHQALVDLKRYETAPASADGGAQPSSKSIKRKATPKRKATRQGKTKSKRRKSVSKRKKA